MDVEETEKRFPGVKAKLNAPKPLSAYAREQKAAEAKKREDEAANAEALKAFEESLQYDGTSEERLRRDSRDQSAYSHAPRQPRNLSRNHFPTSGPGSLDNEFDHRSGPPNRKRRRDHDQREGEGWKSSRQDRSPPSYLRNGKGQEEDDAPKVCIYLDSLAPNMTSDHVKEILRPHLSVEEVQMHGPAHSRSIEKKAISATAFLASDTTTKQVDDTITKLRNHYVGCGFELKASRIKLNSNMHPGMYGGDQPFGAQPVQAHMSLKNAPPPGEQNRWAPPDRYDQRGPPPRTFEVNCDQQLDLNTVRAIHVITDQLLSQPHSERAMELESLLMSLPEVQQDRRFAFLYDSRSPEGLYYRYCLWRDQDKRQDLKATDGGVQLWDDVKAQWRAPDGRMLFTDLVNLADAVQHDDYASSDEENEDEQEQALPHQQKPGEQAKISITPIQKAHLTHLLARLPTAHAKLRRGDVARVSDFAISHAATGVEDIVDMLLLNVDLPFSSTSAAKYEQDDDDLEHNEDDNEEYDPEKPLPSMDDAMQEPSSTSTSKTVDMSGARFIALYVINDIVKAQNTSDGARYAWKYRQLLENGLKHQKTFERLGTLDRQYSWGKLKTEQWKRKIFELLDQWEKQSVFSGEAIGVYRADFLGEDKGQNKDADGTIDKPREAPEVKKPKWISQFQEVKANTTKTAANTTKPALLDPDSVQHMQKRAESTTQEDPPARPSHGSDEAISNAPNGVPNFRAEHTSGTASSSVPSSFTIKTDAPPEKAVVNADTNKINPVKKRMRAEDMFAEEDD